MTTFGNFLFITTTAIGLVAPPLLERAASRALDRRLARCHEVERANDVCGGLGGLEVDIHGLHLANAWHERPGVWVEAERVDVRPLSTGVLVRVSGLEARYERGSTPEAQPPGDTAHPNAAPERSSRSMPPVFVHSEGSVELVAPGGSARIVDPQVALPGDGSIQAIFDVTVARAGLEAAAHLRASTDRKRRQWKVDGTIAASDEPAIDIHATVSGTALDVDLAPQSGGGGSFHIEGYNRNDGPTLVRATAEQIAGDVLAPLQPLVPHADVLDLGDAVLSGNITLSRSAGALQATFDGVTISGLVVESPQLSRQPVELAELGLDGDVRLSRAAISGELIASHGSAQLHVAGTVTPRGASVDAELPAIKCQDLLRSMPRGFFPALEGMRLTGSVAGALAIRFAFAQVRSEALLEPDPERPPPGTLELEFPFLDACVVADDAPHIDIEALRGPYRHRFVTTSGAPRHRIMAAGAPGYIHLGAIPRISRAFVLLEDTRFWIHDGFDRGQIERAFWHNLGVGGIHRGGSTITQQAARNLWLGIDRSLSRKLQEAVLAARLEAEVPKGRILELYVNVIELGPGIHGVAEAAQYHFGKRARDLDVLEAIHLASLAPAPRLFSERFKNGRIDAAWRDELRTQVKRMRLRGWITQEEMRAALRQKLVLVDHSSG